MNTSFQRSTIFCAAACFLVLGAWQFFRGTVAANSSAEKRVTFNRDLAPVVFRACAPCHHPGEAAPFSLLTYGDVKSHARQIADLTEKRIMPPWLPEPGDTKFTGDLASEMDIEDLLKALSDYLLDSGFRDPYLRFQDLDHTLDNLR